MELRQKAAALEEMKYLDSKNQPASGSGTPGKPRLTYAQALEQLNAGNTNDVVMEAANYYGLSAPSRETLTGAITNRTGTGWIAIDGLGRFSTGELSKMIDNGTVKAIRNADGSITYQRA